MFNSSIYALQLHMNIDMKKLGLLSEATRNEKVPNSTKMAADLVYSIRLIHICTMYGSVTTLSLSKH